MGDVVEARPKCVTWECLGWADCPYFHIGVLCDRCEQQKQIEAQTEGDPKP